MKKEEPGVSFGRRAGTAGGDGGRREEGGRGGVKLPRSPAISFENGIGPPLKLCGWIFNGFVCFRSFLFLFLFKVASVLKAYGEVRAEGSIQRFPRKSPVCESRAHLSLRWLRRFDGAFPCVFV